MRGQVGAVRGGGGRASEQFGALAARMLAALEATQAYQKATLHKTLKFTYVLQDVLSEAAASCTDGGGDVHEDDPTAASAPSQAGTRLDMTGDGHHESVGYDTTGDGRIDALDTVGDSRVDARIVRGPSRPERAQVTLGPPPVPTPPRSRPPLPCRRPSPVAASLAAPGRGHALPLPRFYTAPPPSRAQEPRPRSVARPTAVTPQGERDGSARRHAAGGHDGSSARTRAGGPRGKSRAGGAAPTPSPSAHERCGSGRRSHARSRNLGLS